MEKIVVEPLADGWAVRSEAVDNVMVFKSGSAAEDTARGLAFKLAQTGEPVKLHLKLRNSPAMARFLCLPPIEPGAPPHLIDIPDARMAEREPA